jgi:hypothetical protein
VSGELAVYGQIRAAFPALSEEECEAALLLVKARAETMGASLDRYMERFHPDGLAERDERLPEECRGCTRFLGDDAKAVIKAGKSADFSTFVHESAHVFRRRITGKLLERAERAFGVERLGKWSVEQEEAFALGLEEYIRTKEIKDGRSEKVFRKGRAFVRRVYNGLDRMIEMTGEMRAVYGELFEAGESVVDGQGYEFNRQAYEERVHEIAEGGIKGGYVFMGATPPIYEELGFERLPVAMARKRVYTTINASGMHPERDVNYHGLGEDILKQIPEKLKDPLCVVQSDSPPEDIVSVIEMKDKDGRRIIAPIAQSVAINRGRLEIAVNLVKGVYGNEHFERFLERAAKENRLLYANKKRGLTLPRSGPSVRRSGASILVAGDPAGARQDVSGFYIENIARYKEIVKSEYKEKREILYQRGVGRKPAKPDAQLSFNFDGAESPRKPDGEAARDARSPVETESEKQAGAAAEAAARKTTRKGYERPIALGDVIVTPFRAYEIDAIHEGERTLGGKALDGGGERRTVSLDKCGYHIVPRPDEETRRLLLAIGSEAFFDCPDRAGVKETAYTLTASQFPQFPRFASEPWLRKELAVVVNEYKGRTLNPYNKSDREEIVKLAGQGAAFLKGGAGKASPSDRETRRSQIEFVRAHFPDIYAAMEPAIKEAPELFDGPEGNPPERARESQVRAVEKSADSPADSRVFAVGAFAPAAENTPENFFKNVGAIASGTEAYKDNPVEAARELLRASPPEARAAAIARLRALGCASPQEIRDRIQAEYENFKSARSGLKAADAERADAHEESAAPADAPDKGSLEEGEAADTPRRVDLKRTVEGKEEAVSALKASNPLDLDVASHEPEPEGVKAEQDGAGVELKAADAPAASAPVESPRFRPYGAWTDYGVRLTPAQRERINAQAEKIAAKEPSAVTEAEKDILRRYSGFGGLKADGERGVLYDFYTSPPVAAMTWRLLEKAGGKLPEGAKVLEPSCGTGVFFEAAPPGASLAGVEIDPRAAAIASALYADKAEIAGTSFEQFNLSEKRGGFDAVIGNAPFGERSVETSFMDKPEEKSLDRYFVSRSIDNLKPGGVLALITAPGPLENKSSRAWRLDMSRKARFLGAAKLGGGSFRHAGTAAQPVVLLFRRLPEDMERRLERADVGELEKSGLYDADFIDGSYFETHGGHIMGEVSKGAGRWGADEVAGEVTPESVERLVAAFTPVDEARDEEIFAELRKNHAPEEAKADEAALYLAKEERDRLERKELGAGSVKVVDCAVYLLDERHIWRKAAGDERLAGKMTAALAVSELARAVREAWRNGLDGDAYTAQQHIKLKLEAFKTDYGNYPGDDGDIRKFLNKHPSVRGVYEGLAAPESEILAADNPYKPDAQRVDGHNPAVSALLALQEGMRAGTEENIAANFPGAAEGLIAGMYKNPDIFLAPGGVWELREDFISGDAWEKIDALQAAAEAERDAAKKAKLAYGADELREAAGWTPIEEADFSPHSSWMPEHIVNQWVRDENVSRSLPPDARLARNAEDKWGVVYDEDAESYEKGGWKKHRAGVWEEAHDPVVYYLNMQKQRSVNIDTETYNRERNDNFKNYIACHAEFRDSLERRYNRLFNSEIAAPVKTYPVHLEGWNDGGAGGKKLRPHQWQTVHHLYRRGKGISALGAGFGKTLSGIALMTLLRQEGRINRAWLQVPNNKVKDWVGEIKAVMPSLKVAYIDAEDKEYGDRVKRYRKYQAMAGGKADVVVMPESAASEIQLSPEEEERVAAKIAVKYKIEKAKEGGTKRELEKASEKGRRQTVAGKANRTVCFEDFGCDAVFVDEGHRFKNLFSSSLSRETGMNDGRKSDKAMALFKKTEFIRDNHGGKNVFMFTATPLANSPLEYFNMLSFVAPEELERFNIHTIDGFIKSFADIQLENSYDWKTGRLESKHSLIGFKNIQALQSLFFKYTDYQNDPSKVKIEKPLAFNRPNVTAADAAQSGTLKGLSDELARYQEASTEERRVQFPGQNFLTFYSKMRAASLDLELHDPQTYAGWKNPKLEKLARNAFESFQNTKGGQVVFCDRVFSSDKSFNMHDKIKRYLADAGFKRGEIVIVNGFAKSGGEKSESAVERETEAAVKAFNEGGYKVMIGTTACIGEGLNLQKNSAALHHFDIPYRPSDFIQRNGRIDRQGNAQPSVALHTYMSAGTIDNYSVGLVQKKANWIDKLLKTKSNVFANPEGDGFVDADEILLALTEEWGDKDRAEERRAELEGRKADAEAKAWGGKRGANIASLSLLRGTTVGCTGDKGTKSYQSRVQKIAQIEKLLANNPALKEGDRELLESGEAFLYAAERDVVFRKGDMFLSYDRQYAVKGFDFKKQAVTAEPVVKKWIRYGRAETEYEKRLSISGLRHEYKFLHIPQPDAAERSVVSVLHTEGFYRMEGEELKGKYYSAHLAAMRGADCDAPALFVGESGALLVKNAEYAHEDALNPFAPEGRRSIGEALEKGVEFPDFLDKEARKELLDTLEQRLPRLGAVIKQKTAVVSPPFENTPDNLKKNVIWLEREAAFRGRAAAAARHLIELAETPEEKKGLMEKLRGYGCVDPTSTNETTSSWASGAMMEEDCGKRGVGMAAKRDASQRSAGYGR